MKINLLLISVGFLFCGSLSAQPKTGDRAHYRITRVINMNPNCGGSNSKSIDIQKFKVEAVKALKGDGTYTHQFSYVYEYNNGSTPVSDISNSYFPNATYGHGTIAESSFRDLNSLRVHCTENGGEMESVSVPAGDFLACKLTSYDRERKNWFRAGFPFGLVKTTDVRSNCNYTTIELISTNR